MKGEDTERKRKWYHNGILKKERRKRREKMKSRKITQN
jgi:hypothetical protein